MMIAFDYFLDVFLGPFQVFYTSDFGQLVLTI